MSLRRFLLRLAPLCLLLSWPVIGFAEDAADSARAATTDTPADAIGMTTCAPWDGPAIQLQIARHGELECPQQDDSVQQSAHYDVRIYQSWSQIQARRPRQIVMSQQTGAALDCPGKGQPCKQLEKGMVDFSDDGGVLYLPMSVMQGMTQPLPFKIRWCEKLSSPCG